jgi:hypothetical protein
MLVSVICGLLRISPVTPGRRACGRMTTSTNLETELQPWHILGRLQNISVNGQRLWNGSGATPVRSEDTRNFDVNETPLFPPVPEWPNRSVYVPRPPLHRAASPPRPHQFFSGREADTGPHQSKNAGFAA